ncbi:MAG: hypothetical protein FJX54_01480 [Alphaproteobacteria bacterium]|nr:hypothetical protein [Alphaproteobacteria bacterium]
MSFLAAVLDTLLPGDRAALPLPPGSGIGIEASDLPAEALAAIASEAGSEAAFEAASPATRTDILRRVEAKSPSVFQALLTAALMRYYQSDAVMTAMGWRTDPPQPKGRPLAATDAATWERLKKVKSRGRIWR